MSIPASLFLSIALSQQGDPYIFGHEVSLTDPNPRAFDCSELVQWAAAQAGTSVPDGAINQYNSLKGKGLAIPVSQAIHTPGALLFKWGHGRHAPIYHVGISMGDGKRVMEAKGSRYGTGIFDLGKWSETSPNMWNRAALVPGLDYSKPGPARGSLLPLIVSAALAYYI